MSIFKPQRNLTIYKQEVLDKLIGEITYFTNNRNKYPYKLIILDEPSFQSDEYRHQIKIKLLDSFRKVKYKNESFFLDDIKDDFSEEVAKDLYGLLNESIQNYNKIGQKQFSLDLRRNTIIFDLR